MVALLRCLALATGLLLTLIPATGVGQEIAPIALRAVRYDWEIVPDYGAESMRAVCRLTVKNPLPKAQGEVPLLLYRLLVVEEVTDARDRPVPFEQQVKTFHDWGVMQVNAITIRPPDPIAPGAELTLTITYAGYLRGYTETGMSYVRDRIDSSFTILRLDAFAYPALGVPCWTANRQAGPSAFDYTIAATVPDSLVVANGGELVGIESGRGTHTYRFRNLLPAWRMDVAIARYDVLEREDGSRIYTFPEDRRSGSRIARAMVRADSLYTDWFGPRLYTHGITVIEVPDGWGSQTDVTTIIQTAPAFHSTDNLYQFYHEVSHLWNPRSLDPLPTRVESEGLAMFLQRRAAEALDGDHGAVDREVEAMRKRFRAACDRRPEVARVPIARYGEENLTDLSYSKGMVFFAVLHGVLGEMRFNHMIRTYADTYREGATLRQFADLCLRHAECKEGMRRLLSEWLNGAESSDLLLSGTRLSEMVGRYR